MKSKHAFPILIILLLVLVSGCGNESTSLIGDWIVVEEGDPFMKGDQMTFYEDGQIALDGWYSTYEYVGDDRIKIAAFQDNSLTWNVEVTEDTVTLTATNITTSYTIKARRLH